MLAMHLRGDAFTAEEKARNFAYYEALTVRDSSLSSSTQSIIAAEVGLLQLAHDYLGEAALMDLHDLEHNVRDGVHMGSLAGAWLAVVHGLGGMRHHGESARLQPAAAARQSAALTFRIYVSRSADQGESSTADRDLQPGPRQARSRSTTTARRCALRSRWPFGGARHSAAPKAPPAPKQPFGREPARRGRQRPRRLRPDRLHRPGRVAATSSPRGAGFLAAGRPLSRRRPSRRSRAPASAPRRPGPWLP